MGKGSNALQSRELVRKDLDSRFDKILEDKQIGFIVFKERDDYYFHLRIPSESKTKQNTYDVVLQFTTNGEGNIKNDKDLSRYYVKFFSNSPSFTYTYAYAFNLYGMLADHTKGMFDSKTLTHPPITRNPGEIINYEKSTYFAAHYLSINPEYLTKEFLDKIAKNFSVSTFTKGLRDTNSIENEIKQESFRIKQEKAELERLAARDGKKELDKLSSSKKAKGSRNDLKTPKSVSSSNHMIKPKRGSVRGSTIVKAKRGSIRSSFRKK